MNIKQRLKELPIDLQRKIWEYDDTWLRNFDLDVVPFLQQEWFIKWIELDENGKPWGKYGIDLTDDAMYKPTGELHHNYTRAKKICDRRNKLNDGYLYVPSHNSLGEVDQYPGGSTGHRVITRGSIIYRIVSATPYSPPVTMDNVYLDGIG
tara:strand:+ start:655 stop:1107 length:453 start_codon:yes stop_codon:yes gene_type:complete